MQNSKVFVTGGSGLVGSHMIAWLLHQGYQVLASKRVTSQTDLVRKVISWRYDNKESLLENLEWIDINLFNFNELLSSLEKIDYVIHCAAIVSFNPAEEEKMIKNNTEITANLVDASLKNNIKKFCHVSSVAALGDKKDGNVVDETSPRNHETLRSGYSESKYKSEMEVWRAATEGLNMVIVNPSIIIGPGDWSKNSQQLFQLIDKGLKFYTPGITGYVDVQDVVQIIGNLLESDIHGKRFCLNSENISYKEVFTLIAESIKKPAPSLLAKPWMLGVLWRINHLLYLLTGRTPGITKNTARSAFSKTHYSSKAIQKELKYRFLPMKESISLTGSLYLEDISK